MTQLKYYVFPWKTGSQSAKALAEALGGKTLKREGSAFVPRNNKKVVNWGSSDCPWEGLNTGVGIQAVSNKLFWFRHLKNLSAAFPNGSFPSVPKVTESREEALGWNTGVMARTVLNGHSGAGIVYKDRQHLAELPEASLYVEYIPKDSEYRVHVFNNEVVDVQRKIKDPNREVTDWKVRSHDNGFIYARNDVEGRSYRETCPEDVLVQAKRALVCSGLVFGAVDVIWSVKKNKAYVLEVNSAPGLEGESVNVYATAIKAYYAA